LVKFEATSEESIGGGKYGIIERVIEYHLYQSNVAPDFPLR